MRRILAAVSLSFAFAFAVFADSPFPEVEAAVDAREFDRAVALLGDLRAASPDDPDVWVRSAKVALAVGERARALEYAEEAARIGPSHADARFTLGISIAANLEGLGAVGAIRGVRRMRGEWERAVELDPEHLQARLALAGFYAGAPRMLGGGAGKARAQVAELEARDTVWGHRAQAMLHLIAEDVDAALREYDAALDLAGDDATRASLHAERGMTCQNAERWDCAHESFTAAVALNPMMVRAYYQIGRTAVFSEERIAEGIEAFHHYLTQTPVGDEPSLAWAHVRLAALYRFAGDDELAREHLERALAISTEADATAAAEEGLAELG
jgi:tetratricopeptide (TPR) repeat protein